MTDEDLRNLFAYPDGLARPRIRVNFIVSVDGAVTLHGSGRALGTPVDRRVFTRLRDVADVVLVGAATAKADPYMGIRIDEAARTWRSSHGLADVLPVAVVSSRGVIAPRLLKDASVPPIVFVSASAEPAARLALQKSQAKVIELPGNPISCAAIRDALMELGLRRVLCEGGPVLFSTLASGCGFDEVCLTTSPMIVAGPSQRIASSPNHVEIGMTPSDILVGGDGTVIVRWVRR